MEFQANIPVPSATRAGRPSKYDFSGMQVGESFASPAATPEEEAVAERKRVAACVYAYRHGWKMCSRRVEEDGKKVMRVWRLS